MLCLSPLMSDDLDSLYHFNFIGCPEGTMMVSIIVMILIWIFKVPFHLVINVSQTCSNGHQTLCMQLKNWSHFYNTLELQLKSEATDVAKLANRNITKPKK